MHVQANALSGVLHKFYELKKDSPKDRDIYLRTEHSKALLLFHCAIVALLAEGFHMPPDVFDSFRDQMELTPIQMREIFRSAGRISTDCHLPHFRTAACQMQPGGRLFPQYLSSTAVCLVQFWRPVWVL